jgi:sporulation protein YlmC with PRC-barrel domain
MNQTTRGTPKLYRFGDLRGRQVFDDSGEEVGTVQDLFLDEEGQEVRYLDVRAGGFLGLSGRMLVIPPHVVDGISEDRVTLNESRQKVIEEPQFSPGHVLESHDRQAISRHFGGPPLFPG